MKLRIPVLMTLAGALGYYTYEFTQARRGYRKIRHGTNTHLHSFSVVVAARNEEDSIGTCLEGILAQDYPSDLLEVVIVNDRSGDRTAEIVKEYASKHTQVKPVHVTSVPEGTAPKKHAVTQGIAASSGEIILVTDADCRQKPTWVSGMNRMFEPGVGVVAGHVEYRDTGAWFNRMQALDYLSLSALGKGLTARGQAILSAAANLAYRRSAYDEAGGFGSQKGIVSGDDDILLQRIQQKTSWKIVPCPDPGTFVQTEAAPDIMTFIRQRARWSSKSSEYSSQLMPFFAAIFLVIFLSVLTLPLAVLRPKTWWPALCMFVVKAVVDYRIISAGGTVFGQKYLLDMKYYLPAAVLFPYYSLIAIFWGQFGKFSWKGSAFQRKI